LKDIYGYSAARELVASAKKTCDITKPNNEMTDDEIRTIAHWIFERLPDTSWEDGKMIPGRAGIDFILFVMMNEFSVFYQEHGLGQYN